MSSSSMDELYHFEHSSSLISPDVTPGTVDRVAYKFVRHLQLGSYGKVVLAKELSSNENVAIKLIAKPTRHSSFIARHELSILKRLKNNSHKNICELLNYFQTENYHWFVFEFCSNGDLYDYIANKENDSNPLHFKTLVKELVQVINHSHSKGIYHRDIKPENILIDESKSIKLTDWGLSTLSIISEDPCVGTEKYMAPETFFKQSKKAPKPTTYNTKAADYWSLGITLLYVLFKRCPWRLANISDENFKLFVQDPFVLFDWYPKLSNFGFECILNLLQLNPVHRSLDRFYEKSIVKGFEQSFIIDETYNIPITPTLSSTVEEDLLFGMEIDDDDHNTNVIEESSNKVEDSNDSFIDTIFDENAGEDKYYDDVLTPMTPALQTPVDLKMKNHRIPEFTNDKIQPINSSLHFKKLDTFDWN